MVRGLGVELQLGHQMGPVLRETEAGKRGTLGAFQKFRGPAGSKVEGLQVFAAAGEEDARGTGIDQEGLQTRLFELDAEHSAPKRGDGSGGDGRRRFSRTDLAKIEDADGRGIAGDEPATVGAHGQSFEGGGSSGQDALGARRQIVPKDLSHPGRAEKAAADWIDGTRLAFAACQQRDRLREAWVQPKVGARSIRSLGLHDEGSFGRIAQEGRNATVETVGPGRFRRG